MSFSCPHFNPAGNRCERLRARCVPGRRGCVLAGNSVFAVPPELRVAAAEGGAPARSRPVPRKPNRKQFRPPADSG
ncbi:MAG: hypothetical protein LBR12_00705 [Opitutaceae bacterium]|jgi:hypothetical protein|nr:hypothetical protein [Opitutaceae bacterium]